MGTPSKGWPKATTPRLRARLSWPPGVLEKALELAGIVALIAILWSHFQGYRLERGWAQSERISGAAEQRRLGTAAPAQTAEYDTPAIVVPVLAETSHLRGFVDGGSDMSIACVKTIHRIQQDLTEKGFEKALQIEKAPSGCAGVTGIGNTKHYFVGTARLVLHVGGIQVRQRFFLVHELKVLDNHRADLLLGRDFQYKEALNPMTQDLIRGLVSFADETVPILGREGTVLPLRVAAGTVLPPRSIARVKVKVPHAQDDLVLWESLEPDLEAKGLWAPEGLLSLDESQGWIWLSNESAERRPLYEHQRLGWVMDKSGFDLLMPAADGGEHGGATGVAGAGEAAAEATPARPTESPDERDQRLGLPDARLPFYKAYESKVGFPFPDVDLAEPHFTDAVPLGPELTKAERDAYRRVFRVHARAWARSDDDLGCLNHFVHKVQVKGPPIRSREKQLSSVEREFMEKEVRRLEKLGCLKEVDSPWRTTAFPVLKKNGTYRLVQNMAPLKDRLVDMSAFPLPRVDELLRKLAGKKVYSCFDHLNGYWACKIDEELTKVTAFAVNGRLWGWVRLPMGLSSSPAAWTMSQQSILRQASPASLCYLDDLLTVTSDVASNVYHTFLLLKSVEAHGGRLKVSKGKVGFRKLTWLGVEVSEDGLSIDKERVESLRKLKPPKNRHEIRRFVGLCRFNGPWIPRLSSLLCPILELQKKGTPFFWSQECQRAFDSIPDALVKATTLAIYGEGDTAPVRVRVWVDASKRGMGGAVYRLMEDGSYRPVAFVDRPTTESEDNLSALVLEAKAIYYVLMKNRAILHGIPDLVVYTDHKPNASLFTSKSTNPTVQRIKIQLQEYFPDMKLEWIPGAANEAADALSRGSWSEAEKAEAEALERRWAAAAVTRSRARRALPDGPSPTQPHSSQSNFSSFPLHQLLDGRLDERSLSQAQRLVANEAFWREEQSKCAETRELGRRADTEASEFGYFQGVLYNWDGGWKPVIPSHLQQAVLRAAHDCPLSGAHVSKSKMIGKIRQWGYFKGMAAAADMWAKSCSLCASLSKPHQSIRPPLQPQVYRRRLSHWSMDIFPGLPETTRQNSAILALQCQVTKWPVLVPMGGKIDAREVALSLAENVWAWYGYPLSLVSDAGPQMTAALSRELSQVFHFDAEFSSPRHQQANPAEALARQVFKVHRAESWMPQQLIKNELLSWIDGTRDWDRKLNLLMLPFRNSDHASSGRSPAELVFGQRLRLAPDSLLDTRLSYAEEPSTVAELISTTLEGTRLAVSHIQKLQQERKVHFDKSAFDPIEVGSRVRLKVEIFAPGSKLKQLKWKGPYVVLEKERARNAVLLGNAVQPDAEPFWANVSKLKVTSELLPGMLRDTSELGEAKWGRYGRRGADVWGQGPSGQGPSGEPPRASERLKEQRARLNKAYLDFAQALKRREDTDPN